MSTPKRIPAKMLRSALAYRSPTQAEVKTRYRSPWPRIAEAKA